MRSADRLENIINCLTTDARPRDERTNPWPQYQRKAFLRRWSRNLIIFYSSKSYTLFDIENYFECNYIRMCLKYSTSILEYTHVHNMALGKQSMTRDYSHAWCSLFPKACIHFFRIGLLDIFQIFFFEPCKKIIILRSIYYFIVKYAVTNNVIHNNYDQQNISVLQLHLRLKIIKSQKTIAQCRLNDFCGFTQNDSYR